MEYKNIQRRVYDALNVLMALGLVTKEKQGIVKCNDKQKINFTPNENIEVIQKTLQNNRRK